MSKKIHRSKVEKPQVHRAKVTKFSSRGEGVVSFKDKKCFIPFAFPEEEVDFTVWKETHRYAYGSLKKVVRPSCDRQEPACEHAMRCGGCLWMGLDHSSQQALKKQELEATLKAILGNETQIPAVDWTATEPLQYRRRARLKWLSNNSKNKQGTKPTLGYSGYRQNNTISIQHCPVLVPELEQGLIYFKKKVLPFLRGKGVLRVALGKKQSLVFEIVASQMQEPKAYQAIETFVNDSDKENLKVQGVLLEIQGHGKPSIWGEVEECFNSGDGFPLFGAPRGFMQANDEINRQMSEVILKYTRPEEKIVVELFAGVGNWSVHLAKKAKHLIAIESFPGSKVVFEKNIGLRNIQKVTFHDKAAEDFSFPRNMDVLVLDPPREGAEQVIKSLQNLRNSHLPKQIVYISCHLPSFKKDAWKLVQIGFKPIKAHGFDMFPQTPHFESVVLFEKKENFS